jgi:metal-responsive CopG/Arc/MetJ family transcriptional regulator
LESLSREDLIKLVRKQMEAAKKKTEKMAKQQQDAKEMATNTKVEQLEKALLATQHKVEELTTEMANLHVEYRKQIEVCNLHKINI